jgi:hypothetical protein
MAKNMHLMNSLAAILKKSVKIQFPNGWFWLNFVWSYKIKINSLEQRSSCYGNCLGPLQILLAYMLKIIDIMTMSTYDKRPPGINFFINIGHFLH